MQSESSPLVTFVVLAYNQEEMVADAIQGAFAQTYSPLEIILSDDCSTDGTFRVMEEMARAYTGPHKIVLNRNPKNLHIGGHISRLAELAQGEWIVQGAGDDISKPERVSTIMRVVANAPDVKAVFSSVSYFSEEGEVDKQFPPITQPVTVERVISREVIVSGFSLAWRKELFDTFGPLPHGTPFEDFPISFRATLLGRLIFLPEPLVRVRYWIGSAGRPQDLARKVRNYTYLLGSYGQMQIDLGQYLRNNPNEIDRVLRLSDLVAKQYRNTVVRIARHYNPRLLSWRDHLRAAWQDAELRKHSASHLFKRVKALAISRLVPRRAV